MTARSANTALENITRGLVRTNLPHLPPAFGFDGDQEYLQQVELWRRWINWEQEDPLVLKDEDHQSYKQRILYVFKQAAMALRFWPEIWVEAAEWCFTNGMEKEGSGFLSQGIAANPESCLLALKHADRLELVLPIEEGDEGLASRGAAVREPYNKLHDSLYELIQKLKAREIAELRRIEESASLDANNNAVLETIEEDDEDTDRSDKQRKESAKINQINAVKQGYAMQTKLLSRTISFVWIALMRAMRRVQGKGKVGAVVGGSRQILNDARLRGRITSDVYVASALIEHNVYKDPAGTKIFERGAKLFPEDETFILEYLKHLLSIGDITSEYITSRIDSSVANDQDARAVFETAVNRLAQKADLVAKTKPLYVFFHKYECEYGELSQITKLERRMADLFPEDPKLLRFASRYSSDGFDPTAVRPIISPATQMRPKAIMQSIEQPGSVQGSPRPQYRQENSPRPQYRPEPSPRPQYLQTNNSPKRPFGEDSDNESVRPRKLARGESPLKGAAGRRLDQQKRLQQTHGTPSWQSNGPATFIIPRDITFLLSIIPRAETYTASRFNPEAMVRLLSQTHIPDYNTWKASRDQLATNRFDNGYAYNR
ncbi:MAG: mRNA 3'-end-processing protein rna14 [Claussenomyces sp. TS43310]|nr:MAG: mRNA 3'-end-processing protein rna14 [Claussenomyces sp. TS43310]